MCRVPLKVMLCWRAHCSSSITLCAYGEGLRNNNNELKLKLYCDNPIHIFIYARNIVLKYKWFQFPSLFYLINIYDVYCLYNNINFRTNFFATLKFELFQTILIINQNICVCGLVTHTHQQMLLSQNYQIN